MKIGTKMLSLELTELCNLDCRHCLKGEAKNVFITKEILDKMFSQFVFIDTLFLTGGEVMLAYEQIKLVLETAKEHNVVINFCEFLTNGTIYDERVFSLLEEFFKGNYAFAISWDHYHEKAINRLSANNPKVLENLEKNYYHDKCDGFKDAENILLDTGRAKNLDVPKREFEASGYYYDTYDHLMLVGPIVFISSTGYLTDGNLAIDEFLENSLGNILDDSIPNLIKNGGIKINTKSFDEFFYLMDRRNYEFQHNMGTHLKFEDHKIIAFTPKDVAGYYEEIERIKKIIGEIHNNPDNIDNLVLSYDFSHYPRQLSQTDHS